MAELRYQCPSRVANLGECKVRRFKYRCSFAKELKSEKEWTHMTMLNSIVEFGFKNQDLSKK